MKNPKRHFSGGATRQTAKKHVKRHSASVIAGDAHVTPTVRCRLALSRTVTVKTTTTTATTQRERGRGAGRGAGQLPPRTVWRFLGALRMESLLNGKGLAGLLPHPCLLMSTPFTAASGGGNQVSTDGRTERQVVAHPHGGMSRGLTKGGQAP